MARLLGKGPEEARKFLDQAERVAAEELLTHEDHDRGGGVRDPDVGRVAHARGSRPHLEYHIATFQGGACERAMAQPMSWASKSTSPPSLL
jgi:hypothetical protein